MNQRNAQAIAESTLQRSDDRDCYPDYERIDDRYGGRR